MLYDPSYVAWLGVLDLHLMEDEAVTVWTSLARIGTTGLSFVIAYVGIFNAIVLMFYYSNIPADCCGTR